MNEEVKSELAVLCDELERGAYAVHMYAEQVGVTQTELLRLIAAARRAEEAERDRREWHALANRQLEELARLRDELDGEKRAHAAHHTHENQCSAFLREHGEAIAFGLMTTASDAETVSDERRKKAFAAVKALGELRGEATGGGTKVCSECTNGIKSVGMTAFNPSGLVTCPTCHGSGRVPNDEAGR